MLSIWTKVKFCYLVKGYTWKMGIVSFTLPFHILPGNKNLALSRSKAFEDDDFNAAQMVEFFFGNINNVVKQGENDRSIFSFSHNVFKRLLPLGHLNSRLQ